jgi:hypothetical protein
MKRLVFTLCLLTASASPSWAGSLTLSIHDGLVSIDAQDVTVRQILTEWARVGKTQIINVERIAGGPITLKLDAFPEKQALDIVLRAIPGYIALPRAAQVADASVYDRIVIMATASALVAAPRPNQPMAPTFPGMQMGGPNGMQMGGPGVTQLRPQTPLMPGMILDGPNADHPNGGEPMEDPAIAAAAAAGLVNVPGINPRPTSLSAPLMPPGGPQQQPQSAPTAPGVGSPTNPWNIPVGTAQPGLAPPPPTKQPQPQPVLRTRPPQADQ